MKQSKVQIYVIKIKLMKIYEDLTYEEVSIQIVDVMNKVL